jgi:hypothetical protein
VYLCESLTPLFLVIQSGCAKALEEAIRFATSGDVAALIAEPLPRRLNPAIISRPSEGIRFPAWLRSPISNSYGKEKLCPRSTENGGHAPSTKGTIADESTDWRYARTRINDWDRVSER